MFEIGYSLRAARERQGIGLPEAELATKIRAKYIRALEEEDFDALPADTYARGFLRTYADYLGLDGEIYVDEYASRFHNAEWDDEPRAPRSRPARPRRERTIERRALVLALAGIAVVAALVVVAWKFGNSPSPAPPALDTHHKPSVGLVLHGVGRGTFVVVRRNSRTGQRLFRGRLTPGQIESFTGKRFYLHARRPSGVRTKTSGNVELVGG
ncbi:MAG TPA: helix-turn-helix domain-containing protein [Gaiellaceae bacterium]